MRLKLIFLTIFIFFISITSAQALSPRTIGLAGSGLGGMPQESLFLNPAAIAVLDKNRAFGFYARGAINSVDEGGKLKSAGVYDAQNPYLRAGFAYIRESQRRRIADKLNSYEDREQYRVVLGKPVSKWWSVGTRIMYTNKKETASESSYVHADLAAIFSIWKSLNVGVQFENITAKSSERSQNVAVGIRYALIQKLDLFGDLSRILKGSQAGEFSWATGLRLPLVGSFALSGGLYQDSERETRGYAMGLAWDGPRLALAYSMKVTKETPIQRDHVFGLDLVF